MKKRNTFQHTQTRNPIAFTCSCLAFGLYHTTVFNAEGEVRLLERGPTGIYATGIHKHASLICLRTY
jgi:hypothetical protein